jgi:hypothetical protein
VVHDERTAIGEVPRRARQVMFMLPKKTEDDDLAGVSALMKAIPGSTAQSPAKRGAKKTKRPRLAKRRAKNPRGKR